MRTNNRLLIIDDEAGVREFVRDAAEEMGYEVIATGTPEEFFAAQLAFAPTVMLIDLMMPDTDGVEILRALAERPCEGRIALISGADGRVLKTAHRVGEQYGLSMIGTVQKPVSLETLEDLLQSAWVGDDPCRGNITDADIGEAIRQQQFVLYYQPKVALNGKGDGDMPIAGAEALIRWVHPDRGLVPPGDFIPLAEESDLIGKITGFVLEEAIGQMRDWRARGIDLSVAINMPPDLLSDLALPDRIAGQLAEAGIPANRLVLEITERGAIDENAASADILTRFRLKNIGLSLDDFGVGYSSLVELYRQPFSELKLDRSFVTDVDRSEEARIMVRAMVGLAQNLKLSTCAEGVETQEALAYLRSIGCDKAQGYLISKPLPADKFATFIKTWNEAEEAEPAEEKLERKGA